jgi:uncharacterized protein YegL
MPLPGGQLATRPLHFIWICDCSGSMSENGKIQALNNAIRDVIPLMQKEADENPNARVLVQALKFSTGARWHIPQPTPIEQFRWSDLTTEGVTDLGAALKMVADQLKVPPMSDRALPPVLVLLSDGMATDDYKSGIQRLMDEPWGKKSVRIAIAIGGDADYEALQRFIGNPEIYPLQANNPEALVRQIKWVSTAVLKAASSPVGQVDNPGANAVPIPQPPPMVNDVDDVW